jgi:hypothetical protein
METFIRHAFPLSIISFSNFFNCPADHNRDDGKRFVVRADQKVTAFLELESAIRADQRLATAIGWTIS